MVPIYLTQNKVMKSHVVMKPKRIPNHFRTGAMVIRMMDVKAMVMMMSLTLRPSRTSHIMMIGYSLYTV